MPRWATITLCLITGCVFGWLVPLDRLFDAFQPVMTALTIMAAAILVRLNRTMPTIDWKILSSEDGGRLTAEVVKLAEEYLGLPALPPRRSPGE